MPHSDLARRQDREGTPSSLRALDTNLGAEAKDSPDSCRFADDGARGGRRLTMHQQMPLVLHSTVGHHGILRPARQKFPVVLDGRHVAQHASRDVRTVCELRRTQNPCRKKRTLVRARGEYTHISGHVFDLMGPLPPGDHRLRPGTRGETLDLVRSQRRYVRSLARDVDHQRFHCNDESLGKKTRERIKRSINVSRFRLRAG